MQLPQAIIGNYYGADWVGMAFMALSVFLLGNQKRIGFLFGVVSSIGWLVYAAMNHSIPNLISECIVISMSIRGFYLWTKSRPLKPQLPHPLV